MKIFDGNKAAAAKEVALRQQISGLATQPIIGAVLFKEDAGSRLYTRLKKEAAERVGVGYSIEEFYITDPIDLVARTINQLNIDHAITGIIIQKPTKQVWFQTRESGRGEQMDEFKSYSDWWSALVSLLDPEKDVDGLHPSTLTAIERGTWQEQGRVLPATAQAVIEILIEYCAEISANSAENDTLSCLLGKKVTILGKSDLLGKPLYYLMKNKGITVEMIGSKELAKRVEDGRSLLDADVIISATGRPGLITGEMVKDGVVVIDVGEPKGDVDFASVKGKAAFITPVPGGVGPMTVGCLLANAINLANVN